MDNFLLDFTKFDISQIELLVTILTLTANTALGLLVLMKTPKSWTSRIFALLALVFDFYIVSNFLSLHPPSNTYQSQFFWIKMVMFSASFKGPLLFLLVHTFPSDKIKLNKYFIAGMFLIAVATGVASLSSLVFSSLSFVDAEPLPVAGPAMPLFVANFAGFILASFILLIIKYYYASGEEKAQQLYLTSGLFISLILIGIFSLVSVVVIKTSSFVFLGPLFVTILISSISYAIAKHNLFNTKVIAANLLVIAIWVVLLSKVFVGTSSVEVTIDIIILVSMIFFGILLVRSVQKEVDQREKLQVLTVELEDSNAKLINLTKQLEIVNEKIKEADRLKSEFLSFASHQVKAPMTVVKGYASLIYDGTYGPASDKIKETAMKIQEAADRLISLVNNLLDIRRIEEGKMEYKIESTDLTQLLLKVTEEMGYIANLKKINLSFEKHEENIKIQADANKFRQVIQNIIENAIKYTAKGWIKIKLEKQDSSLLISIQDSGQGIPPEVIPKLFHPFERGSSAAKRIEGTGIGLYLAKQIVEAHKGQIWAESKGVDTGSTFFIKLPAT